MNKKLVIFLLLFLTTSTPIYVVLTTKAKPITYRFNSSKYEFPLGTDKKIMGSILGQPIVNNNHFYYSPLDKGKIIGLIYMTQFDKNNKLISQDVSVGCCPKTFIIEPISVKNQFLNFFRKYEIVDSPGFMFLYRTENTISQMDQFLKRNNIDLNNPEYLNE